MFMDEISELGVKQESINFVVHLPIYSILMGKSRLLNHNFLMIPDNAYKTMYNTTGYMI